MKRISSLLALCFLATWGLHAAATNDSTQTLTVQNVMTAGPVTLLQPLVSDSVNIFGDQYDVKQMLKTKLSPDVFVRNSKQLTVDSMGWFVATKQDAHAALTLFRFDVTARHFTKAKLKITSPQPLEVYVNGEKTSDKTSVQKSLEKAATADHTLTMEPQQYEIIVKCLTQAGDSLAPSVKIQLESKSQRESDKLVTAASSAKRPFTLHDVLDGERPSGISISADGKYAILRTSTVFPKGRRSNSVTIMDVATGKSLLTMDDDKGWNWMPRGSRLYYTKTGAKGRQLILIDVPSMQETVLTETLPEGGFRWTPDERFLLFSITDNAPESHNDGVKQILTPEDRQPGWRNRSFIYRYELATGLLQQLVFGYRSAYIQAVSPDSKSIIFSTSRDNYTERPFGLTTICRLYLDDLKVDTLWKDIRFGGVACFSPDGKQLLLRGGPESFGGIGKSPDVKGIPNDYDGQAFIYTFADKKIDPITLNFNPSINSATWSKIDGNIYFNVADEDYERCYRYSPKTGKFTLVNLPCDVLQRLNIANDALIAVGTGQSASYATTAFRVDLRSGKFTTLADPLKTMMEQLELGRTEDWNFRSTAGDLIKGRVYYPPHYDATKKYPVIVYYYGGTSPTERTFDGRYPLHLYAGMGYLIYVIQPSGTYGFGQAFSARHVNAWGKRTADEIIEGTERFCDEHQAADRSKIGCIGASYGGFMTMYLQTRTDIFAAAVSHAGISDITSYWGEGYWGYSYNSVAAADSYPWNNPELFVGQSPLFSADKVKTPILLLHGDADTNVPVGESIQFFTALKILGKPVEFISIAGQNHHILDYDKRIRWNNSIFAWFAKWLQNDDAWWNELYPKKNL